MRRHCSTCADLGPPRTRLKPCRASRLGCRLGCLVVRDGLVVQGRVPRVWPSDGPSSSSTLSAKPTGEFVVIKDLQFERELEMHQLPAVQACKYIRQAVDVIEKGEKDDWTPSEPSVNKQMVLEWMDTDLWHIRPFGKPFSNPKLPAIVSNRRPAVPRTLNSTVLDMYIVSDYHTR
ncbi:hypothetical protein VTO42DRAFT_8679 [Malbranchea cinnamomea]